MQLKHIKEIKEKNKEKKCTCVYMCVFKIIKRKNFVKIAKIAKIPKMLRKQCFFLSLKVHMIAY